MPLNIQIGRFEFPLGLALITVVLFAAAVINLFTKQVATISGVGFTLVLYTAFVVSERRTARRLAAGGDLDQFQLLPASEITPDEVEVQPGNVLVPVRDYNTLSHLAAVLREVQKRDVVVMTVRVMRGPDAGGEGFQREELFTDYEQRLFTKVVAVAERQGRPVRLLIVPSSDPFSGSAQTAVRLRSSEIAMGESANVPPREQARLLGDAWDRIPEAKSRQMRLVVYCQDGRRETFSLGVHAPDISPADLDLIHELWLQAYHTVGSSIHHRDIVTAALQEFADELNGPRREAALRRLKALSEQESPHT